MTHNLPAVGVNVTGPGIRSGPSAAAKDTQGQSKDGRTVPAPLSALSVDKNFGLWMGTACRQRHLEISIPETLNKDSENPSNGAANTLPSHRPQVLHTHIEQGYPHPPVESDAALSCDWAHHA